MKKIIFTAALLLIAVFVGCQSDEQKIENYKKTADEYISNYEANNIKYLLAKIINLNTQKIFYLDKDDKLMVYDFAAETATEITPSNGYIDEVKIYNPSYHDNSYNNKWIVHRLTKNDSDEDTWLQTENDKLTIDTNSFYKNRIFLTTYSDNDMEDWIFYVNSTDNSLHLVAKNSNDGYSTKIKNGSIITKRIIWSMGVEDDEVEEIKNNISMSLSDEEYKAERIRQEEEEKRIYEEIKNRPKTIEIYARVSNNRSEGPKIVDMRGCDGKIVQGGMYGWQPTFTTGRLYVPDGKMWISDRIESTDVHGFSYMLDGGGKLHDVTRETIIVRGGHSIRFSFYPAYYNSDGLIRIVFSQVNDY